MSNTEPAMEDSLVAPHKLNRITTCPAILLGVCGVCIYVYPKMLKTDTQILKHLNVHRSTIYNSQKSRNRDFSGGPVVKHLPANAEDTGSNPALG